MTFQEQILQGIPAVLPQPKPYEPQINHAPTRKEILTEEEKKIIDARLEMYHQNPELGSPWEDVYKRIVEKQ